MNNIHCTQYTHGGEGKRRRRRIAYNTLSEQEKVYPKE